ncbi:hypothetical protein EON67_03040 [archaeon]|nr:MAG: hypothetical protein EON67_03040 [archaeon]
MQGVAPSNPLQQRSASAQLGGAAYAPAERGERPAGDRPAGDRPAGDRAARPALAHDDAVFNKFRRRELGRMR